MDKEELEKLVLEIINKNTKENKAKQFNGGDLEKVVRTLVNSFMNNIQCLVEMVCNKELELYKDKKFQKYVRLEYMADWVTIVKQMEKLESTIISTIN